MDRIKQMCAEMNIKWSGEKARAVPLCNQKIVTSKYAPAEPNEFQCQANLLITLYSLTGRYYEEHVMIGNDKYYVYENGVFLGPTRLTANELYRLFEGVDDAELKSALWSFTPSAGAYYRPYASFLFEYRGAVNWLAGDDTYIDSPANCVKILRFVSATYYGPEGLRNEFGQVYKFVDGKVLIRKRAGLAAPEEELEPYEIQFLMAKIGVPLLIRALLMRFRTMVRGITIDGKPYDGPTFGRMERSAHFLGVRFSTHPEATAEVFKLLCLEFGDLDLRNHQEVFRFVHRASEYGIKWVNPGSLDPFDIIGT